MYLRPDHATSKIQDGGHPTGEAPELLLAIPEAACSLDDGVQRLLVWLGLDEDHLGSPRSYGFAANEEFDGCVANLAFGIGPMAYADQGVAVATCQFDRAAVIWSQGLDDAMSAAFCLHRQWRPNAVGCEA